MKKLISKDKNLVVAENKLIDVISNFSQKDCKFLKNTKAFKEFLKNINDLVDINWEKVIKINRFQYRYGSYILKFGFAHSNLDLPQLDEFVKFYCRINLKFKDAKNSIYFGFEIQDFIESNEICSEKELYTIYSNLRDKGYIWADASYSNVKKLNDKFVVVDLGDIYIKNQENFIVNSKISEKFHHIYLKNKKWERNIILSFLIAVYMLKY